MIPSGRSKYYPFFTDGGNCLARFGRAGGGDIFTGAGFGGGGDTFGGFGGAWMAIGGSSCSADEESELDAAFCGTAGAGAGGRTDGCSAAWLEWELDDDLLASGDDDEPEDPEEMEAAIRSRPQVCVAGVIPPLAKVSVGRVAVIPSLVKVSAAGEPRLGMAGCSMTSARRQLSVGGTRNRCIDYRRRKLGFLPRCSPFFLQFLKLPFQIR
jgi:hypothetical protein